MRQMPDVILYDDNKREGEIRASTFDAKHLKMNKQRKESKTIGNLWTVDKQQERPNMFLTNTACLSIQALYTNQTIINTLVRDLLNNELARDSTYTSDDLV